MAKNNKQNNGVPYQRRYGCSSYNSFKVRNNGYTLEGSGTNPIKGMKRLADIALLNYGAMKQSDNHSEFGRKIGIRLLDTMLGEIMNTTIAPDPSTTSKTQDPGDLELVRPMSFAQMLSRPMSHEDGVIAEGYILKGQITFCVAGADSGKTIFAVDTGIAAASGTVPTYLPQTCRPSERMNVLFYQLEERAGEIRKRYGAGNVFSGLPFQWIMRTDLHAPTQDCLIANIKGQCKRITKDTLIICDPLSKLDGFDAAKFIKEMEILQIEYAEKGVILSFFCTAHTEEDKPWKPLTSDQILGGDKLLQQAGSVFSIRQERGGKSSRFLQTLKPPKGEIDKETVSIIKFVGRDEFDTNSYTHLEYLCEKAIQNALPKKTKAEEDFYEESQNPQPKENGRGHIWDEEDDTEKLKALIESGEELDYEAIAKEFGCSSRTIKRRVEKLKEEGSEE